MDILLTPEKVHAALLKALPFLTHAEQEKVLAALIEEGGRFKEMKVEGLLGMKYSVSCPDICAVADLVSKGVTLRVFVDEKVQTSG